VVYKAKALPWGALISQPQQKFSLANAVLVFLLALFSRVALGTIVFDYACILSLDLEKKRRYILSFEADE
jgi:hypothetical protein